MFEGGLPLSKFTCPKIVFLVSIMFAIFLLLYTHDKQYTKIKRKLID